MLGVIGVQVIFSIFGRVVCVMRMNVDGGTLKLSQYFRGYPQP